MKRIELESHAIEKALTKFQDELTNLINKPDDFDKETHKPHKEEMQSLNQSIAENQAKLLRLKSEYQEAMNEATKLQAGLSYLTKELSIPDGQLGEAERNAHSIEKNIAVLRNLIQEQEIFIQFSDQKLESFQRMKSDSEDTLNKRMAGLKMQ
jgi:chromosome segregation ATPase